MYKQIQISSFFLFNNHLQFLHNLIIKYLIILLIIKVIKFKNLKILIQINQLFI